jgi:hypothetical protein
MAENVDAGVSNEANINGKKERRGIEEHNTEAARKCSMRTLSAFAP